MNAESQPSQKLRDSIHPLSYLCNGLFSLFILVEAVFRGGGGGDLVVAAAFFLLALGNFWRLRWTMVLSILLAAFFLGVAIWITARHQQEPPLIFFVFLPIILVANSISLYFRVKSAPSRPH